MIKAPTETGFRTVANSSKTTNPMIRHIRHTGSVLRNLGVSNQCSIITCLHETR